MKKIINLYKPVGLTPLEVIKEFKEMNIGYDSMKMSYAGRLDPMAEGVLLVLVGDENKKIREYMGFDKEYRAEILIGLSSDSGDVLGIIKRNKLTDNPKRDSDLTNQTRDQSREILGDIDSENKVELIKDIKKKFKSLKGSYVQKIPNYSSYKIKGKPMFYYAREGIKIGEVRKKVVIKNVRINSVYEISNKRLLKYVDEKIGKVDGDFRQEEILERWSEVLGDSSVKFLVFNVLINCSSGTYIRAIADDVGNEYGGGLLLSLNRFRVGKFKVENSLRVR